MNETTAAQLLREGANYIDEHGWTQRAYVRKDGCACLLGAMRIVATGHNRDPRGVARSAFCTAERAVDSAVSDANEFLTLGQAVAWNDRPGRTAAEVTAKMREVAAKLEAAS